VITPRDAAFIIGVAAMLIVASLVSRSGWRPRAALPSGQWRPAAIGVVAAGLILFASLAAPDGSQTFIYFQF
jgi:hypothetical protein